jgi:tetratricopeptide (TPR) repeat protein
MKTPILLLLLVTSFGFSATFAQTQTRSRTVDQDVNNIPDPVTRLREEIEAAPNDAERNRLRLKLADALLAAGNKPEAIAELNKIARSNAFDPIAFYNLGNSFARLGESESAISAYRTAIEQRKGYYSRAYNNLGVVLLRAGRWDEAQEALVAALKIENFRYAEASYNLGRVYAAKGQNDLAARQWRRTLVVDPQHDAATQALAGVRTEERIMVVSKPATAREKTSGAKSVETVAAATKSPVPNAAKPLELDQASFDFLQRARDAYERGKLPLAVDNFRRVLSREHGYFAPANLELSYVLLILKRDDEALTNLVEVTKHDGPRYPISYYHLARLYERRGELKLSEAAFAQAATLYKPTNAQFILDLSRVREKLGDFKGSLEAMENYLKAMQEQGQKPVWSDERIAELRSKATKQN